MAFGWRLNGVQTATRKFRKLYFSFCKNALFVFAIIIVRIVLMYYLNLEKFLNQPDADLKIMLAEESESPPDNTENC